MWIATTTQILLLLTFVVVQRHEGDSLKSTSKYTKTDRTTGEVLQVQVSTHAEFIHCFTFCNGEAPSLYPYVYYWFKHVKNRALRFSTANIDWKAIRLALMVVNGLETNPGPRRPKFPCGICSKACKLECIACDDCEQWLHKSCIGMSTSELNRLGDKSDEWK
jgi:hypothetical protein